MKIILSRKGFDSSAGGTANMLIDGKYLQPLPIPDASDILYSSVHGVLGETLDVIFKKANITPKLNGLCFDTCHLDPDIFYGSKVERPALWKGCFEQSGAAQKHLENNNVSVNDIFLFFGWFQEYFDTYEKQRSSGDGSHIIYGYLQIGEIFDLTKKDVFESIPEWLKEHPHFKTQSENPMAKNTIYVARPYASWDDSVPGYGLFTYSENLKLTKDNLTRSKWKLNERFSNIDMTYHSEMSWKDDYFQSAARGQEFVIDSADVFHCVQQMISKKIKNGEGIFHD